MLRKTLLPLFSVLLFLVVLEGTSYYLDRAHIKVSWEESYVPGEIWNLDNARQLSKNSDQSGAIARLILNKGYNPEASLRTYDQNDLHLEPPVYLNSEYNKTFLYKPWKITPNLNENFSVIGSRTSRLKYKAHYTTDESGRRIGFRPEKYNETYVFLGCSFTFGLGVNNEESIPYQFGKKTGTRTYNLGIPGSSPSTFLHQMRKENVTLLEDVEGENVTVVLTIIPEQVMRVVGTTQLFRNSTNFEYYPYFYLANDKLEMSSFFSEGPGLDKSLLNMISHSNFLSVLNLELPLLREKEYLLFARVVEEIQNRMKETKKVSRFAVALFPTGRGQAQYNGLKKMLTRLNIEVLDYSLIKGPFLLGEAYSLRYDGHPSPLTYDLFTDLLAFNLVPGFAPRTNDNK